MGCAVLEDDSTSAAPKAEPARALPTDLPVAVLGAGPVGLAAVARLIERGIQPLVLEAGEQVGANLLDYRHVRLFSPWRYNVDAAMAALLEPTGWQAPPADQLPPAGEIVERVLKPFAACLLYTSPSPRDRTRSRMPSSA